MADVQGNPPIAFPDLSDMTPDTLRGYLKAMQRRVREGSTTAPQYAGEAGKRLHTIHTAEYRPARFVHELQYKFTAVGSNFVFLIGMPDRGVSIDTRVPSEDFAMDCPPLILLLREFEFTQDVPYTAGQKRNVQREDLAEAIRGESEISPRLHGMTKPTIVCDVLMPEITNNERSFSIVPSWIGNSNEQSPVTFYYNHATQKWKQSYSSQPYIGRSDVDKTIYRLNCDQGYSMLILGSNQEMDPDNEDFEWVYDMMSNYKRWYKNNDRSVVEYHGSPFQRGQGQ